MTMAKKQPGRPTKYEPKKNRQAQKLIMLGLTQGDLAVFFGVDEDTITRWKERHPYFADAIKRGVVRRKMSLSMAMYKSGITQGNVTMQIFLAKNWLGMTDRADLAIGSGKEMKPLRIVFDRGEPKRLK